MGMRKAINDMCRACIYDQFAPGNWRQQVTACTSPRCPLYPHRPVSKSGQNDVAAEDGAAESA